MEVIKESLASIPMETSHTGDNEVMMKHWRFAGLSSPLGTHQAES